jgi:hypothetical protein
MERSESIKELAIALSKAQGSFNHAKKDTNNPFFKSQYADLASVIDAAKHQLFDNGLSVIQIVDSLESGDINLITMLLHSSGEYISGNYPIRPLKSDPQSIGSAITYARRYSFSAITGIASDDDDGNAASNQQEKKMNFVLKKNDPVNITFYTKEQFDANFDGWYELVLSGKKTAQQIVGNLQKKFNLSQEQIDEILKLEKN